MAIKKSDLYSSLWASCDELRGGMDASQYKDYVPPGIGDTKHANDSFQLAFNYIDRFYVAAQIRGIEMSRHWRQSSQRSW